MECNSTVLMYSFTTPWLRETPSPRQFRIKRSVQSRTRSRGRWNRHKRLSGKELPSRRMDRFQKRAVFGLVSPESVPPEHKVIGTKCAFTIKADHTLKGGVAVQGWEQVAGIDRGCKYAPVCRVQHIRKTLAKAASKDWQLLEIDVQTAFPNARAHEEVCVKASPRYESPDVRTGRPSVIKCQKSLCGLRQSPRLTGSTPCTVHRRAWNPHRLRLVHVSTSSAQTTTNRGILTMYVDDALLLG